MQHMVEVFRSEGFAWGAVFGLGVSLALDGLALYLKSRHTK